MSWPPRDHACSDLSDQVGSALVHLGSKNLDYSYPALTAFASNSLLHHLYSPKALWGHPGQLAEQRQNWPSWLPPVKSTSPKSCSFSGAQFNRPVS